MASFLGVGMIRYYGRDTFRECKLFLNELPSAEIKAWKKESRLYVTQSIASYSLAIGFEIFIARGATFSYGLIGGKFEANSSHNLNVEIFYSDSDGMPYLDALSGSLAKRDNPKIELINEFVPGAIEGIETAISQEQALSGNLKITHAVSGEISSSHNTFKILGSILWSLIVASQTDNSLRDDVVKQIIDRYAK
jgi:hypothetical protein